MKITDVRAHVLRSPLEQPFAFSQGWVSSRGAVAAIPDAHHALFGAQPLLEFDMSSHPFRERLTDRPLRHKGGWVEVPRRPGLGIEVSREVVKQYSVTHSIFARSHD